MELSNHVKRGLEALGAGRLTAEPYWGQGLTVLTAETARLPLVVRKALAIKMVLSEMPAAIGDHELIVGRALRGNVESMVEGYSPFPQYATDAETEAATAAHTGPGSVFGHFCPDYARFLSLGIGGLRRTANDFRQATTDQASRDWYDSVVISLDALADFVLRYRDLALQLAAGSEDGTRRGELLEIAEVCGRIADGPPQSFREALQAVWFANAAFHSTFDNILIGRFDQFLYPFMERDVSDGRITLDQTQELVDLFWLKCCDRLKNFELNRTEVLGKAGSLSKSQRAEGIGMWSLFLGGKTTQDTFALDGGSYTHMMMTVVLSGMTADGRDATNPLTYACLNATLRLRVPAPYVYLRLHDGSPAALIERAADCLRAGCVSPSIMNDGAIVAGLQKFGIPLEDAVDYATSGCFEVYVAGKTDFKYGFINAAEVLSRVLSPAYWATLEAPDLYLEQYDPFIGTDTPDPRGFGSFEEVMDAFKFRLEQNVKGFVQSASEMRDGRLGDIAPDPLLSAFVEGPLETGRDLTRNSMRYHQHTPLLNGLSHAADSLAVIKKLVFDDKTLTMGELLDAVEADWEGYESLRQMVMTKVPAYGNDIDYVDDIARETLDCFATSAMEHGGTAGGRLLFIPGVATFEHYPALGKRVPALPNGRRSGEPLANNASPSMGRAVSGQTAAINSFLKLPLDSLGGGACLDIEMQGGTRQLDYLESILAGTSGGNVLTVTVNDCSKLRAARESPEKHRDLIVRVAGHSAYFVDLPTYHQDRLIERCEQYGSC